MPFIWSAGRRAEGTAAKRAGRIPLSALVPVLLLLLFQGSSHVCTAFETQPSPGKEAEVFVGIPPLSSLVDSISGGRISVHVLVQPGQNPHTFEPTPRQMTALSGADAYFAIGLPFEERILKKVRGMNPDLTIVRADAGVVRRVVEDPHHTAGEARGDGNAEPDPHIWLGPSQLESIARNVCEGLAEIEPNGALEYRNNLNLYLEKLHALDGRMKALLEPYRGMSIFVYHPAFGYFTDAYGLIQVPVEIEGKEPTPRQIEQLVQRARQENVHFIFVSPQFDRKTAEVMAEAIKGTVISVDPLAEDILGNLKHIASILDQTLRMGH